MKVFKIEQTASGWVITIDGAAVVITQPLVTLFHTRALQNETEKTNRIKKITGYLSKVP